jgi:hypothetical protein
MKSWPSRCHRVRIVPDTRVSAFTYAEALDYLRSKSRLVKGFTREVFDNLDPEQELLQAVDDYFMPTAYAEIMQN